MRTDLFKSTWIHSFKRSQIVALAILGLLLVGLIAGIDLIKSSQDNRQHASSSTGTATLALIPATSSLAQGTRSIVLQATTGSSLVDGFQAVIDVSGTIPSNFTFTPTAISGLSTTINKLETVGSAKKLTFLAITSTPTIPYVNTTPVTLGTFNFTAPATGTMTLTFNPTQSKITQNSTSADILLPPLSATYTFTSVTPTPSSTSAPTPTATPTGDTSIPEVTIIEPSSGATLQGSSRITTKANAVDNVKVTKVEFWINNSLKCTDTSYPYSCTQKLGAKRQTQQHTIQVRGYDAAGNIGFGVLNITTQ